MKLTDGEAQLRHEVRGLLHELSLGLNLYRHLIESQSRDAEAVFDSLLTRIQAASDSHLLDPFVEPIHDEAPPVVLVVDDSINEREYLARLLRANGVPTATASDGVDAIRMLRRHIPAVVLIDMQMPRCDGPELIGFLKASMRFDGVAIYGLSASTAEEAGVDDGELAGWILKPLCAAHIAGLTQHLAGLANVE